MNTPMRLHTRAVFKARRPRCHYWERMEDFGIPYTPDRAEARRHPKVTERWNALKAIYGVVDLEFEDKS